MDEHPARNTELQSTDLFTVVNNYFLLFYCASCILASMYVQQMFMMMDQYRVGISVSAVVGIILPMYLLTRRFEPGVKAQFRITALRAPRVLLVVVATLATVVIVDHIYLISQHFNPVPEDYMDAIRSLKPETATAFVVTFIGLCVLVPISEEIVFRGVVQQIFARNMGPVVGFVLAGTMFGAVHLNPHLLISISFFGVFLGFVYYATGNLGYTILSHSLFNMVALLQLTFASTTEASTLPFYLRDVRIFVFSLVVLVFLLLKIKQGGPETEPPYESETDIPTIT